MPLKTKKPNQKENEKNLMEQFLERKDRWNHFVYSDVCTRVI